jgi:hypothetical protein
MTTESTSATNAASPLGSASSEGLGAAAEARSYPACKGKNCGCTDGVSHSPECKQEHDDAAAGVMGRCSVPMWMHGCPAGHCDHKAYGVRPPSRTFWSYPQGRMVREDGRYDGYVPGLACPGHGGPEAPNARLSG